MAEDRGSSRINPISVPKAADILASQLRQMIIEGAFAPGTYLPNERDLVTESGLSRTSVRDALRILETDGLISTRVGRTGGSMVTLPGREAVARSVELFVRTHGIRLESLLDCRVAVEPMLARLAARNRTQAQLDEMTAIHEKFVRSVDNVQEYKAINLDWHLAVARASGNEPLTALMEAITRPVRDAMNYQHVTTPELRSIAVKAHSTILSAIADGNEVKAAERMERHVSGYRDIATEHESGEKAEKSAIAS